MTILTLTTLTSESDHDCTLTRQNVVSGQIVGGLRRLKAETARELWTFFKCFLYVIDLIDWKAFARHYNGPAYAQNRYDEKLSVHKVPVPSCI